MGEYKPAGRRDKAEETDKRALALKRMHRDAKKTEKPKREPTPEDGVVEMDGGVMLTTSEILDIAEGTDSVV